MRKTVGRFTYDSESGEVTGPALYFKEQGDARLSRILEGKDELFNQTAHLSPDIPTAVLVWLQTDYAGWLGRQEIERLLSPDRG